VAWAVAVVSDDDRALLTDSYERDLRRLRADVARLAAERDALGEALAKARTPGCKACGGGM